MTRWRKRCDSDEDSDGPEYVKEARLKTRRRKRRSLRTRWRKSIRLGADGGKEVTDEEDSDGPEYAKEARLKTR